TFISSRDSFKMKVCTSRIVLCTVKVEFDDDPTLIIQWNSAVPGYRTNHPPCKSMCLEPLSLSEILSR
ncbi:7833_t:CDS:1, partial [Dentiscutata erythropus]